MNVGIKRLVRFSMSDQIVTDLNQNSANFRMHFIQAKV